MRHAFDVLILLPDSQDFIGQILDWAQIPLRYSFAGKGEGQASVMKNVRTLNGPSVRLLVSSLLGYRFEF